MKPTSPASLFVDTSVETWPLRGPSEMNLAVIRLKLHSTVFGLRDHLWGGRKALKRTVGRELSVVAVKAAREALGTADELLAFVDPVIFRLDDWLAWEVPAMKLESN